MKLPEGAKLVGWAGLIVGLGAVVVLAAWQGFDTIAEAFAALGAGFLLLIAVFALHVLTSAWSWRQLFAPGHGPSVLELARAIWIAFAVDVLLPVATVGGEVVKVRLLLTAGQRAVDAIASVVVDKTVQAVSIVLWGLAGALGLLWLEPDSELFWPVVLASLLLALGTAGFAALQRSGAAGFMARRLPGARWQGLVSNAGELDAALQALYRRRGAIVLASLLRFASRLVLTLEVWLVAHFLGHPIGLLEAMVLKSLVGALRSAVFVVPNGWGIQEGGFILLGGLFGLPPDATLAISLATRAREILVAVAGLAAWQQLEGWSWRKRRLAS